MYRDQCIQNSFQKRYQKEGIVGDYMIKSKVFLIDAAKEDSDTKFANHSCDANTMFVEDDINSEVVHIVAMIKFVEG